MILWKWLARSRFAPSPIPPWKIPRWALEFASSCWRITKVERLNQPTAYILGQMQTTPNYTILVTHFFFGQMRMSSLADCSPAYWAHIRGEELHNSAVFYNLSFVTIGWYARAACMRLKGHYSLLIASGVPVLVISHPPAGSLGRVYREAYRPIGP